MTRATDKAVRRIVETQDGEFVVEVFKFELKVRPIRTRRGGPAEVQVPWGAIYYRAMLSRAEETVRAKRKGKTRRATRRHL